MKPLVCVLSIYGNINNKPFGNQESAYIADHCICSGWKENLCSFKKKI